MEEENKTIREAVAKVWHQGMPLTTVEIETLAKIIDQTTGSIIINVGQTQLKSYFLAYKIRQIIKNTKSHAELKRLIAEVKQPPRINKWDIVTVAREISKLIGAKPPDLIDKIIMEQLQQFVFSEIKWKLSDMHNRIRHEMIDSIMNNETPIELARRLHKTFETYKLDMRRVAITETTRARNKGTLTAIKQSDPRGGDTIIYFSVAKDACKECKRLYLYPDGSPQLFRIRDIENETNYGKPKTEWKAALIIHPNDRCYPVLYNQELEEWKKKWNARLYGKTLQKALKNDPVRKVININGVEVHIEWPKGTVRTYTDSNYATKMCADYGYIPKTNAPHDNMDLDCYIGKDKRSNNVYVLHQMKNDGTYDEPKYMLGYRSAGEAKKSYLKHMPRWMFGKIEPITWDKFKAETKQAKDIEKSLKGYFKPFHKYIDKRFNMKTGKYEYIYENKEGKQVILKEHPKPPDWEARDKKYKEIIEAAGAKYIGVIETTEGTPDLVLFDAPSGNTYDLDEDKVTVENVIKEIGKASKNIQEKT